MVSPSKAHQHQQEQPPRENKSRETDRHSHARIQKGPKPLERKTFYLDIKNHALSAKLEAKIKDLGGAIELFLVRSVTIVVSDRVDKSGQTSNDKRKWGWASGESGGPPSLRSIEVPTPTPTPPTPSLNGESPLANSTNLRGQTTQRSKSRADAMLERALTQPQQCSVDPLKNAQIWGIPIWATEKLQAWLGKIFASLRDTKNLKRENHVNSSRDPKLRVFVNLKAPFIKFESYYRDTKPVFLELPSWPKLNFDGDPGSCPFDTKRREKREIVNNKEAKENREGVDFAQQDKDKEMTRRPRATATRARRTEQLVAGHCEICRIEYRDLSKHIRSDQHLNFVRNDDNFLSLDTLINAGASVEAFLKLNRANDTGKDCNLFPNEGRSLRTVVLPDDKVDKTTKSDLNGFAVEEINMVQCNGARRNLNLKLSSPHNLRTRTKHESGHLLRSKGSPWHEIEKSDKFYDKYEGFTIKKRAKGTIWIEEEDPDDKCGEVEVFKNGKQDFCKEKGVLGELNRSPPKDKEERTSGGGRQNDEEREISKDLKEDAYDVCDQNGLIKSERLERNHDVLKDKNCAGINGDACNGSTDGKLRVNGYDVNEDDRRSIKMCKHSKDGETIESDSPNFKFHKSSVAADNIRNEGDMNGVDVVYTENEGKSYLKGFRTPQCAERESKEERPRGNRVGRRGGRSSRGRHRLSVEERLIEDNRAYYKVEVLGNKLRSSAVPGSNSQCLTPRDIEDEPKKDDAPSSEKPVVVRFKRVRKSELSLLSDEAESFMFGEPKRGDSSEDSEDDQSSVLPKDTESECDVTANSFVLNSPIESSSPVKHEVIEEDSQDSLCLGRARKRRRTQAEVFIKDNVDYYKFETPGSRLRYQTPVVDKESTNPEGLEKDRNLDRLQVETAEQLYPSKPSPQVEKMQFSFEAVPKSEPWYQTYQRQDDGSEFWHYFSESDVQKPFLLPYEIENFHETLSRGLGKGENRRKGRGRGGGTLGRSPRKSPRCHASTLAIMSTIIRKKELQAPNLSAIEEESQSARSQANTPKPDVKSDQMKSDIDEQLKEVVRNIDDMLCGRNLLDLDDSFEPDMTELAEANAVESHVPKGPPLDLLELLDNCHDVINYMENSSCASSECGEASVESPLKRRKRRKNRTGWPGNKLRKKLQAKQLIDGDCERENVPDKCDEDNRLPESATVEEISNRLQGNGNKDVGEVCAANQAENEQCRDSDKRPESGKNSETCTSRAASSRDSSDDGTTKRRKSLDNCETNSSRGAENCQDPVRNETCDTEERTSARREDIPPKKNAIKIEISENSLANDENHENLCRNDTNSTAMTEKQQRAKSPMKRRQRGQTVSPDSRNSHPDADNHENACKREVGGKKCQNANTPPKKRQQRDATSSEMHAADINPEHRENVCRKSTAVSRKQSYSRKRLRKDTTSSEVDYDDENCKETCLGASSRKQQNLKNGKNQRDTMQSEGQDVESECATSVSERVSPTIVSSSDYEQRRSSIEFQPVVRMTKIDDQVEMDNGVLSVTVASNRRLRSSSSPRSTVRRPRKRFKNGTRGQFGRWMKNS